MSSAQYWRHAIDWARVWNIFVRAGEDVRVAAVVRSSFTQTEQWRRNLAFESGAAFQQWIVDNADILVALHLAPPPDRWAVFDIDMRPKDAPLGAECGQRDHQVCAQCWPRVIGIVGQIDRLFRQVYLPHTPRGLVVYTGNNGVHVWYPIMNDGEAWTLGQFRVRRSLMQQLTPLLPAEVDWAPFAEPWHLVRCPYSWHAQSQRAGMAIGWTNDDARFPPVDIGLSEACNVQRMDAPSVMRNPEPRSKPQQRQLIRSPIIEESGPQQQLYIRVAKLLPSGKRYGPRYSEPITRLLGHDPLGFLRSISLIIPSITTTNAIPSAIAEQTQFEHLVHRRYFGYLDMDTPMPSAGSAAEEEPMYWGDLDNTKLPTKVHDTKMEFVARLRTMSMGEMAQQCPRFGRLVNLALAIAAQSPDSLVYYSGGAGFRVLFHSPSAWRRVVWGDSPGYAEALVEREVMQSQMLETPPMSLGRDVVLGIGAYIDANVYHRDKGVKPDVHAHFETGVWPQRVRSPSQFLALQVGKCGEDRDLTMGITAFWVRVMHTIPPMDECETLDA